MEVTRELRLERLSAKKGTAPIRITFRWESLRLRLDAKESCRPADWNEKLGRVKDKPGLFADAINAVLERWSQAATDAHQHARRAGERWDKPRMEAEIRVRFLRLSAEAAGRGVTAAASRGHRAPRPAPVHGRLDRLPGR